MLAAVPIQMAYFAGLVLGFVVLAAALALGSPRRAPTPEGPTGGDGSAGLYARLFGLGCVAFGVVGVVATAADIPSARRMRLVCAVVAGLLVPAVVRLRSRPART